MILMLSLIILFISAYIFYSYFQNIWIIASETIIAGKEIVLMLTNKELLIILLLFLFSPITMYCTKKYLDKIYYG
jgi:hypothetical protein